MKQYYDGEGLNRALRELYRAYGYSRYTISKFEEYDFYARNKAFLMSEQLLTFTEPNGRLMALKPDVTLSIVKNAKPDALQKLFYTERVYRVPKNAGGFREIMQTGLECIGKLDAYCMSEVVLLAAESLRLISPDYVLDVSDLGILSGLLTACTPEETQEILAAFGEKNPHALRAASSSLDEKTADMLAALLEISGPLAQMLPQVEALPLPEACKPSLSLLKALAEALESAGATRVNLDFSVINDMDYYTGLIFRGFVKGVPEGVLSGGRYDRLLARMGKPCGAIGFAVYLDQLERLFAQEDSAAADILLRYDDGTPLPLLMETALELRAAGKTVLVQRGTADCRETLDLRRESK